MRAPLTIGGQRTRPSAATPTTHVFGQSLLPQLRGKAKRSRPAHRPHGEARRFLLELAATIHDSPRRYDHLRGEDITALALDGWQNDSQQPVTFSERIVKDEKLKSTGLSRTTLIELASSLPSSSSTSKKRKTDQQQPAEPPSHPPAYKPSDFRHICPHQHESCCT